MSLAFYREVEGGGFKARIYADAVGWRIEVESRDASISLRAECRAAETCTWIHSMFIAFANTVAVMVENPNLATEATQFIQELLGRQASETKCG